MAPTQTKSPPRKLQEAPAVLVGAQCEALKSGTWVCGTQVSVELLAGCV